MEDKELINQFVKDLSYQTTTIEKITGDIKKNKRRIREFEKIRTKKTHYKNYFQKIIQNRNSIKTLATKTNNLYNDFIEFMDLSNWDRNMIVSYKEIQMAHVNLYQRNIIGSFQALEQFLEKQIYHSFRLKDDLIQEYLSFVSQTMEHMTKEIKSFEKKYQINISNTSKLRTMLLSKTPQFVSKEMLGQCINLKCVKKEVLDQLFEIIEKNNKRFSEYQLEQFKKEEKNEEMEEVFVEPAILPKESHVVTVDYSDYRINQYLEIIKNFYYDSDKVKVLLNNILDKLSEKEYYRFIQKMINEMSIYQELLKDKKISKKEQKEFQDKLKHLEKCIQIIQASKVVLPEEEKEDRYHLLYATNISGDPYIVNELSKLTSKKAKESFLTCLNYLTDIDQYSGDFTKIRKLVNDDSLDIFEAKSNQVRLLFNYLPHKCIYIIQLAIKKSNRESYLSTSYTNRVNGTLEQYKKVRSYLKENGFTSELQRREEEMNQLILEKVEKKSLQKKK